MDTELNTILERLCYYSDVPERTQMLINKAIEHIQTNANDQINTCHESGFSPLHFLTNYYQFNDIHIHRQKKLHLDGLLRLLIAQPAIDIHPIDSFGNIPLHYLSENGNLEIFKELISKRKNIACTPCYLLKNEDKENPLHFAIKAKKDDIINHYLTNYFNEFTYPEKQNITQYSALHYPAIVKKFEVRLNLNNQALILNSYSNSLTSSSFPHYKMEASSCSNQHYLTAYKNKKSFNL